jgi:uncharacterized protein YegL
MRGRSVRHLPVYVLIDIFGSTSGEPIDAVRNRIQALAFALRRDPCALAAAHLSVITLFSVAKQGVPLTEQPQSQLARLTASCDMV